MNGANPGGAGSLVIHHRSPCRLRVDLELEPHRVASCPKSSSASLEMGFMNGDEVFSASGKAGFETVSDCSPLPASCPLVKAISVDEQEQSGVFNVVTEPEGRRNPSHVSLAVGLTHDERQCRYFPVGCVLFPSLVVPLNKDCSL